eukprot:TRINITY_DN5403_c0_g1_i2.p2 TRINITY_DN5403_c0_g1~~TRINITY_DN5403_c0_g1_i2.p2  ORF type:complete len:160 (+),score=56.04 TRINITY_DN5403_c0_g1_i2:383-862(+)
MAEGTPSSPHGEASPTHASSSPESSPASSSGSSPDQPHGPPSRASSALSPPPPPSWHMSDSTSQSSSSSSSPSPAVARFLGTVSAFQATAAHGYASHAPTSVSPLLPQAYASLSSAPPMGPSSSSASASARQRAALQIMPNEHTRLRNLAQACHSCTRS